MSVTVRPYVNGGWEVDIRVELPDGTDIRERKKAPSLSKTAAQRWAEARERVLLVEGKPKQGKKEEVQEKPTLREFAPRFIDGYAKANRLKPSGSAGKKSILSVHLIPLLGDKRLDAIQTEDVQHLKSALGERAAKTVNNVLTTLSVMLRTAVEWDVIERVPCVIKLLKTPKNAASFHDFEEFERLVDASRSDLQNYLVVLLGGEAGLRCGEIMALEWTDVDLNKRQLCVARSEWKNGGRSESSQRFEIISNQRFLLASRPSLQLMLAPPRYQPIRNFFDVDQVDRPTCGGVRTSPPFLVPSDATIHVVGFTDIEGGIRATQNVDEVHDSTDDDAIVDCRMSRLSF